MLVVCTQYFFHWDQLSGSGLKSLCLCGSQGCELNGLPLNSTCSVQGNKHRDGCIHVFPQICPLCAIWSIVLWLLAPSGRGRRGLQACPSLIENIVCVLSTFSGSPLYCNLCGAGQAVISFCFLGLLFWFLCSLGWPVCHLPHTANAHWTKRTPLDVYFIMGWI